MVRNYYLLIENVVCRMKGMGMIVGNKRRKRRKEKRQKISFVNNAGMTACEPKKNYDGEVGLAIARSF